MSDESTMNDDDQPATRRDLERLEVKIDGVEQRLTDRIDGVEQRLTDRIDGVEQRLTDRIDGVELRIDGVELRIDGFEQRMTGHMLALEQRVNENMQGFESRVLAELGRYVRSMDEDVATRIWAVDDQYKTLPAQVANHEQRAALEASKPKRTRRAR